MKNRKPVPNVLVLNDLLVGESKVLSNTTIRITLPQIVILENLRRSSTNLVLK